MKSEAAKREIIGFMYAERVKSALIVAGQLLDVLAGLDEKDRPGALKMLGSFVRAVGSEMRLAANIMDDPDWNALGSQLNLMEGYARLGQMETAKQELSRTLSQITTLSGRAMHTLQNLGLL